MLENLYLEGQKEWTVKIDEFPFIIGRGSKCHLILSNSSVSREHAKIFIKKDELFIEDCKSTNGTILNGSALSGKKRFNLADVINICGYDFKLVKQDIVEDRTIIYTEKAPVDDFAQKYNLTARERELLSYLIKGISTKEIAESMFISNGTAKNHILNLLKKTNTHSRLELITAYNNN